MSDVGSRPPPPSDGLSGRSLAILLGFLAAFLLVLAFGYYRRHAHLRALREAGEAPRLDTIARRRRVGPRPILSEVDVARTAKQPTWTSMQPLSARIYEPSTSRERHRQRPQPRRFPAQRDLESVMAAAWFGGMQVNPAPPLPGTLPYPPPSLPQPQPPPPPSPRSVPQPELHVAVLVAMPRPPTPSPVGPSIARSGETHDHPPDTRQEVALGLATMPWRHTTHERGVPAMWSADRAADMLA
ncbi:unnamed protein product [Peniophora sp. CBMAI 1063]|nr:unnamed protein product [Peniophora sp. CBMAI 1063]